MSARSLLVVSGIILYLAGTSGIGCCSDSITINGFLQENTAINTKERNPDGDSFKLSEERLQLKVEGYSHSFNLFLKNDLYYDNIDNKADLDFREDYIKYTADYFDIRLGRQIITWGLGDQVFINDIFPKNYEAFYAGKPIEYLKNGIDGIKIGLYPGLISLDVVVMPFFRADKFPGSTRFRMYDPMPGITDRNKEEPATSLKNTEIAIRGYKNIDGLDTSFYFYRGFYKQPSMLPDNPITPKTITLFYPELNVYGMSLQGRTLDGIVSFETGYYDSVQDREGSNSTIPNPSMKYLLGYQKQLWEDFTFGVQYYGEYMCKYSNYRSNTPQGFNEEKEVNHLVSLRLTQLLKYQTLKLSFFMFWSPAYNDYLLNPEVKYNFTDNIWGAIGAQIFGGNKQWSQFGQLSKDDNIYVQLRYEF